MTNRQVAFSSGGMLSAFKPVGDDGPRSSKSNLQSSLQSNPQSSDSHSTPMLHYPVMTSTADEPWEPAVLIKPQLPTGPVTAATPTKRKATSDKAKVKKKKRKQEVNHSGFVPRKIANTSSTVRNPLLVSPMPSEKKEEKEPVKEADDLFSLYDDFDVAPAVAPPTDHNSCSSSIWDKFEATAIQEKQQQQSESSDSEESCDVSTEEEEEATPTMDHESQAVTLQVNASVDEVVKSVDEVQEKSGSGSLQQPSESHPVEDKKESRNERLLRLLGMPMKSFLSAGHQCPLKEHTNMKAINSGSYLDKSQYSDNNQQAAIEQVTTIATQLKNEQFDDEVPKYIDLRSTPRVSGIKKPDGLSFGLSKKREKLTIAGQLFDKEDTG